MADRKFIITIGAACDLAVQDIQEAVVREALANGDGEVDYGNTDVELVDVRGILPGDKQTSILEYKVLDVC